MKSHFNAFLNADRPGGTYIAGPSFSANFRMADNPLGSAHSGDATIERYVESVLYNDWRVPDDHQHYVPQFLLKNFVTGSKSNKQIWVFDKQSDRCFRTSVRNVASQGGFYDFRVGTEARSLDPALQKLENAVVDDIRRVVQHRVIPTDPEARVRIAFFVAVQMVRTDAYRKQSRDLGNLLRREVERRGGWADGAAQLPELSEEESSSQAVQLIPQLARSATPHILSKSWILYATTPSAPFFIGDNPVTLDNTTTDTELMGNLGLASQGIEIYLPVSETLSMGFLCSSNEAMIREALRRAELLGSTRHVDSVRPIVSALDNDEPFLFNAQNVMRHNSLQISYAERYVFSHDDDFSLVRQTKMGPKTNHER